MQIVEKDKTLFEKNLTVRSTNSPSYHNHNVHETKRVSDFLYCRAGERIFRVKLNTQECKYLNSRPTLKFTFLDSPGPVVFGADQSIQISVNVNRDHPDILFSVVHGSDVTIHGNDITVNVPKVVNEFLKFTQSKNAMASSQHNRHDPGMERLFLYDNPEQFKMLVGNPQKPDTYAFQYPFTIKAKSNLGEVVYQNFSPIILVSKSKFEDILQHRENE